MPLPVQEQGHAASEPADTYAYGIATVSMTSLSAFAPAFYLLVPLTLVPSLVRQALEVDLEHAWLLAPGLIVLFVALAFGRNVNRVIAEAIEKRFENLDLIDQLSAQKAVAEAARLEAETANRSKTQFFAAASHDLAAIACHRPVSLRPDRKSHRARSQAARGER